MATGGQKPMKYDLGVDENEHASSILRKFNRMREEGKQCDLIIKVEGKEIHVHRGVMMAGSDYFDAMFSHDTLENKSGVVEMKGLGYPIMKKCTNFIYTGKLCIIEEECEPLLYAAGLLQLATVSDKIGSFLKNRMNSRSFFNTRRVALKFEMKMLSEACDDFAFKNLESIVKEEEFNQLEKKYISFLITSKFEFRGSADSKLAVVLQWVKFDADNRRQHLTELLDLVDLSKISENTGLYLAQQEKLVYESAECMKMLCLAFLNPSSSAVARLPEPRFPPESTANSFVVFDKSTHSLQAYRPSDKSWTRLQALGTWNTATRFTAVTLNGWIYVLMADKKSYKLNMHNKRSTWIMLNDMLETQGEYLRAATHENNIYVVGQKTMEKFDADRNVWKKVFLGRKVTCRDCAVIEFDNHIFTVGGYKQNVCSTDVNKYSPSKFTWQSVTPMIIPRITPGVASHDGKLYVAGGYSSNFISDAEYYDIKTNIWTKISSMNNPRSCFVLCSLDKKLFAIGHYSDPQSFEAYDENARRWGDPEPVTFDFEPRASVAV